MPKLEEVIRRDTLANRPSANAVATGTLFYDTTNSILYRSNGTTWDSVEGGAGAGHDILSATHTDSSAAAVARGALIVGNSTPAWGRLVIGSNGQVLTSDGTDVAWATPAVGSYDATVTSGVTEFVEANITTPFADIPGVGDGWIFVNIDGGGSAITTGVKGDLYVPYSITLTSVTLIADQSGSIVIDIWNDTLPNYPPTVADTITASDKPTLSTAVTSQDSNISTWTTNINGGTTLRFNVDSITTVTRVQMILGYVRRDIPEV